MATTNPNEAAGLPILAPMAHGATRWRNGTIRWRNLLRMTALQPSRVIDDDLGIKGHPSGASTPKYELGWVAYGAASELLEYLSGCPATGWATHTHVWPYPYSHATAATAVQLRSAHNIPPAHR